MIQLELFSTEEWDLDLNDHSNVVLLDGYFPETATNLDNPVTETIQLLIIGSDHQDLVDTIREINRLLEFARNNTSGAQGVWLRFAMDESQDVWRSRVFDGAVSFNQKLLRQWRIKKIVVQLAIERAPDWEGPEEQIPLSNGNDTDNTSGLTVWNHNDGDVGHDNYATIAGEDVEGDLPAACRIEITNTYNSQTRAYTYFVGHGWNSSWPDALTMNVIEAEDADYPTTGDGNSAGASNGEYKVLALPATLGYLCRWDLSQDILEACQGNYFRLMAMLSGAPPAGTWLKAKLTFPAGTPLTVVAESPAVLLDANNVLQEIGVLQLPPWLPGETNLVEITLALYGYLPATGNLGLDFLQLIPLDGYRKLTPAGYGLAYTTTLVDDQISRNVYAVWGGDKAGYYVGTGEIRLQPGKLQRLFFLCTSQTGGAGIDRTASVKLFYRPRRASL